VSAALAARARGGMRDALSMADQLIAAAGQRPTLADCARLAGEGGSDTLGRIADALLDRDKAGVLRALPQEEGGEAELLGALLDHIRTGLVLLLCGADAPMVQGRWSAEQRAAWRARAERAGAARLEVWLQELLMARERIGPIHMQPLARVVLEATLLDLCRPAGDLDLGALAERLAALEQRVAGAGPMAPPANVAHPMNVPPQPRAAEPRPAAPRATADAPGSRPPGPEPSYDLPRQATPAAAAAPAPGGAPAPRPRLTTYSTSDAWTAFLAELDTRSANLADILRRRGSLVRFGEREAAIKLAALSESERAVTSDRRNQRVVSKVFGDVVGRPMEVALEDHNAQGKLPSDPFASEIAQLFDGRIEA
jgi:DNA polymerase-3 subunit gamma/tau